MFKQWLFDSAFALDICKIEKRSFIGKTQYQNTVRNVPKFDIKCQMSFKQICVASSTNSIVYFKLHFTLHLHFMNKYLPYSPIFSI